MHFVCQICSYGINPNFLLLSGNRMSDKAHGMCGFGQLVGQVQTKGSFQSKRLITVGWCEGFY